MNKMMIRDFVDSVNTVHFSYYQNDYFWYCVKNIVDGELYCFPIPRTDVANGRMLHTDRAITYMRWIRQALADGTMKKESNL